MNFNIIRLLTNELISTIKNYLKRTILFKSLHTDLYICMWKCFAYVYLQTTHMNRFTIFGSLKKCITHF